MRLSIGRHRSALLGITAFLIVWGAVVILALNMPLH
jgi:hypothetical protein